MGFFNSLNKFLGENVSIGPAVSGPDSLINYYSSVTSDLKDDDELLSEFTKGVRHNASKRPSDIYLQAIMERCGGIVKHATVTYFENNDHYAVWELNFNSGHKIRMRFNTENARQLTRTGNTLRVGYSIVANYAKNAEAASRREAMESAKRRQRPALESFLGVKFDCPAGFYAIKDGQSIDWNNGIIMVEANVNQFMEFDARYVMKPFDAENVVGVMCVAQMKSTDAAISYMQKVAALFEEKYQRPCKKSSDGSYEIHFYSDEGSLEDEYAEIMLFEKDEGIVFLSAFSTNNYSEVENRYRIAAELKKRQQDEELRQREETAKRDALAAL